MGPEVRALEAELAAFCGARHAVTCASGTDALLLVLMAKGIGPGDAVICPAFTFCATAEVVALVGATPVFVDVDEATFNLDPESCRARRCHRAQGRASTRRRSFRSICSACRPTIAPSRRIAEAEGLFVLDDAAQGFGAAYQNRRSARSRWRPRRASFRRSRSAATATAARSSPTTTSSPRRCAACACTARAPQIRQRAHRHQRPARHHPGRGADREAEDLCRRDRGARPDRAALFAERFADVVTVPRRRPTARPRSGRNTRSACRAAGATASPPRSRRRAFRPRSIIRSRSIAGGLSAFPGGRGRRAGERAAGRGGDQPADACLSRRADAGSDHRGGPARARGLIEFRLGSARSRTAPHPMHGPSR